MKNIWFIFIFIFNNLQANVLLDTSYINIYQKLKGTLDSKNPGFGPSDYGNLDIVDIPKAYAMFLSAELMRNKQSNGDYNLSMAHSAGNWLLTNADLNHNDISGWGVPVAWDAFGDKSTNEANAEYTITTGIVLNSLMDWIELSPNTAPKEKIISTIKEAISPYLDNKNFSSSGLFNYSLKQEDRKYNCFNAAIYMAGQMQRFTKFISNKNLNNKIIKSVNKVMAATLQYKKIDKNGGWYWSYSVEQNDTPNDLAHACYTIDGVMTYIQNNGTLKALFNENAILKHLDFFSEDNGTKWYLFPSFFRKDRTPRTYGLGMALHVYSKYIKSTHKINTLLEYFKKYKLPNGKYSRYQNETIIVSEYIIYMMYGIASSYYYNENNGQIIYLHSDKNHEKKVKNIFNDTIQKDVIKIPFTLLEKENINVLFDTQNFYPQVSIAHKTYILNKYKAVPIKLLVTSNKIIIITRELLTNHLILTTIDKKSKQISYKKPTQAGKTFYDFREASIFDNKLVLVAYESRKGKNTLFTYSLTNELNKIFEYSLPSVESPSGGTYEVVPKMMLLESLNKKKLYILSGRLFGTYAGGSFKKLPVSPKIKSFLEVILTDKNEIIALCLNKANKYIIFNLTQNTILYSAPEGETVFKLSYYYDKVQFRKLSSINDLKELILYDFLYNKGNGTLYLGTNNIEGWLAWSQIYYLNGMLSFLELAEKDIEFYENMQEYVPLMKKRLDLEIKLFLHQMNSKDSLRCRVFSVDRSLQTFAVQSSRFGLLLHRYLKLFPNQNLRKEYEILKTDIILLKDHIETLEQGTSNLVSQRWNPNNAYYLKWPKGSQFIYDGLPVPYNHQNEWATFILNTNNTTKYTTIAESIIQLFLTNITDEKGNLPNDIRWPYWGKNHEFVWWYWWGKAWEGWEDDENISMHTKNYIGDKIVSTTSFKTIDAISILSLYNNLKKPSVRKYIPQIRKMIQKGYIYPYASSSMLESNNIPKLYKKTISENIRFTSPGEFNNNVWAYLSFIKLFSTTKTACNTLETKK